MENLFEGAKFGDKFITRDGRIGIYTGSCLGNTSMLYNVLFEDDVHEGPYDEWTTECKSYTSDGTYIYGVYNNNIVSKLNELILNDNKNGDEFRLFDTKKLYSAISAIVTKFNDNCHPKEDYIEELIEEYLNKI